MKAKIQLVLLLILSSNYSYATKTLNIQTWKTKNHIPVYFVASPDVPIVDIAAVFHAGSAYDGKYFGLASLTNSALTTGAGKYTEENIANTLSKTAGSIGNSMSKDMGIVTLRSLTNPADLKKNLALFHAVLAQAHFPKKPFARLKAQQLQGIKHQQQSPGAIAAKTFSQLLYGNHPYAHSSLGNNETVRAITVKQAKQFYQQYYTADHLALVIVGALTPKNAKKISGQLTQGLRATGKPITIPTPIAPKQALSKTIRFPSQQTHILIGQLGITRNNPEYFPLIVGNFILGGGSFSSRLFDQVREKNGWVYGISSQFVRRQQAGPFLIQLQTRAEKSSQAKVMTLEVSQQFLKDGPTEDEVKLAKQFLMGHYPLSFSNNSAMLNNVVSLAFYHLPLNYFDTYLSHIQAVTAKKIKYAFQQQIAGKPRVTVMVGP
ncbi:MAG: peptidase M16 [marine bacterium B5-7]|nr:MAG: peptidase M16 [marine bacterium B5-7]